MPKQAKHDQGWLFCAATWQVVNIKEEEGKYGLDLRILVFEQVSCRDANLPFWSAISWDFSSLRGIQDTNHPSGIGVEPPCDEVTSTNRLGKTWTRRIEKAVFPRKVESRRRCKLKHLGLFWCGWSASTDCTRIATRGNHTLHAG